MPEIRLEEVSKYYKQENRRIAAVEDINLVIRQGEFVFVTGSSGAGKSTLLQLIHGQLRPDHGSIYLNDTDTTHFRRWGRERYRRQFGYVPQIPQLMRQKTIGENLETVVMIGRRRREGMVQKALGMVGLHGVEDRYPVELSLGECRRVELARAIILSPPVLLLDELTANLDEDAIWDVFHLLDEMNRRGTTIVMATHAKIFVNMMRKRVITLVDGKIFGDVAKGRYGDII